MHPTTPPAHDPLLTLILPQLYCYASPFTRPFPPTILASLPWLPREMVSYENGILWKNGWDMFAMNRQRRLKGEFACGGDGIYFFYTTAKSPHLNKMLGHIIML